MFKITAKEKVFLLKRRKVLADKQTSLFDLIQTEDGKLLANFKLDCDYMAGTISWVKKDKSLILYATPFWEGANGVPLVLTDGRGEEIEIKTKLLPFKGPFTSEKDVLSRYFSLIKNTILRNHWDQGV